MVQPRLFMNMEPPPLDFSALKNYPFPVRIFVRKAHPKEKKESFLFYLFRGYRHAA